MAIEIRFSGGEANHHHIEANDGLEALAGLAHAATLVSHFVITGKVKQRQPYDDRLRLMFEDVRPGSLTVVLSIGGGLAMGVLGNALYDVLKAVFKKATGTGIDGNLEAGDTVYQEGDLEALAEAISPSLLRGHAWISRLDQNITIRKGRDILVDLNESTKSYLKDENVDLSISIQDVSVAALNANSKYGRVFFFDLGRTIPFKVDKDAAPRTTANLSRYLTQYVNQTGATVNIRFRRVHHTDGRLKKIVIYDCFGLSEGDDR